jgi:hypothetical protein
MSEWRNTYTDTDCNAQPNTHGDAHSYAEWNAYSNAYVDAKGNSATPTDSTTAPNTAVIGFLGKSPGYV